MPRSEARISEIISRPIDPVYRELSAKIGEADSIYMPYIFASLVNLEQARILNDMPKPSEEVAQKYGLDKETVGKHLQEMFEKGLLFPGKTGWHLTRSWGAMHDSVGAANPKYDNDDFFDLSFAKHHEGDAKQFAQVKSGEIKAVRQIMRVVPRWKSIKDVPGVLPHEDVRIILEHASPIAVINCACKKIDRERECRDSIPTEVCVTIGRSAQYNLNRGAGKELSFEEAVKLMDELDNHPLVHLTGNTNQMPPLLCNCHNCCCGVFVRSAESKKMFDQLALAKSRFIATVDPAQCISCGICVERCPVEANRMKDYPELGEERAWTDPEACIGCGLCVISCPVDARSMKLVRPPEHIPAPGAEPYATA